MLENYKMFVENFGLLIVVVFKYFNVRDKKIVFIISGGNMDVIIFVFLV